MGDDAVATLANPIINGPFDPPERHFEIGAHGPTGAIREGRRRSESYIPIAQAKKTRGVQTPTGPTKQVEQPMSSCPSRRAQ